MSDEPHPSPFRFARPVLIVLALAVIVLGVLHAIPPRSITIETGPVGGSYYDIELKYRDALQARGIGVELRPQPDSLDIIGDVNRPDSNVDVGFSAQAVRRELYPNTAAAGVIELQPLFIFYNGALGEMTTPASLRGKRIVMPPERSATSEVALRVLRLYQVTPANSQISFMPLADAVAATKAGKFDAGIFMLAPGNAFIVDLVNSDNLRLLSTREEKGITRHLSFLRTVLLPRGAYDMENNIPSDDTSLVAAPVNVVVRKDIHPAVMYTLLDAMTEVHHGSTLISDAGEFPSVVGTDLLPHPLAVQYAKQGIPWIYRTLPLWFASLIDYYLIVGIILFVSIEAYKSSKYFSELLEFVLQNLCLRILLYIERTARPGQPIGGLRSVMLQLIERVLFRSNRRKRSEEVIGRIRSLGMAKTDEVTRQ